MISYLVPVVATLVGISAAAPSPLQPEIASQSGQINSSTVDTFETRNGPAALAAAYSKFGIQVPPSLLKAIDSQASKRGLPNYNHNQLAFGVGLGSGGQGLNLVFDTASADLWVFSTETDPNATNGHNLYNPGGSSSAARLQGATWNVTYPDGTSASGGVYSDSVYFGGLSVQRQGVQSAVTVSPYFANARMDGVLGLAFSSRNTVSPQKQRTWFENAQSTLQNPVYGADFRPNGYSYSYFGRIPSNFGNGYVAAVDASDGLWKFQSGSSTGGSFPAIVDTATSLILANNAVVTAYYRQIQGANFNQALGGWVFNCNTRPPAFTFTVGSGYITVPSAYMVYAQADQQQCYGSLQANGGLPYTVLGSPAIWSSYVILNLGNTGNPSVSWTQKVY